MNLTDLGKGLQHFVVNNSPAIMSGMAVTGVITTTILAVRATPIAIDNIEYERQLRESDWVQRFNSDNAEYANEPVNELSALDYIKLTWKNYIPAAAVGLSTISLIVGAQTVNTRRNTALMTVYSLTENAFKDYKDNVIETLGEKKDQLITNNIAKKRIEKAPPTEEDILVADDEGKILCYESLSGRYFKSDKETIRKAMNDVNKILIDNVYVSLNDFYEMLGLDSNALGEQVGWRSEHVMEIIFDAVLTPKGVPCLSIDYRVGPIHGYYQGF